jgi:Domain of unknown function (DUF1929)
MRPELVCSRLLFPSLAISAGLLSVSAPPSPASADPAEVGELSPLIPLPKDAIHAGLSWTPGSDPKICFGMRPAEYVGHHLVDEHGSLKEEFERFVYGGFGFSTGTHGLDQSVANGDVERDDFVCLDLTHPDALRDTGHFSILDDSGNPLMTQADIALTADAISDAGHSAGLDYNIFCAGNVALADGRWAFVGGHDKGGNNGIRKITIFDPVSEKWVDRDMPPVKADFLADPEGLHPEQHADARNEDNTDPPHPSDMKYQRWYPSAIVLPDKKVLILNGTDQDTSLGPPADDLPCDSVTDNTPCSKVRQTVPEVYDPGADRTIALENASKLQPMYARSYVVQTGPGWHDWKVASVGEADPNFLPTLETIDGFDPWYYTGNTSLLDVRAAMRDPNRDVPGENHWEFVARAQTAHDSGAGVQIWQLDHSGWATSQKIALFGGGCGSVPEDETGEPLFECDEGTVESIDFEDEHPAWQQHQPLMLAVGQNNAVVLPDGKVVIVGGASGRGPWENSFHLQQFDPDAGTITPLVETKVPRHDHSTVALLPDGSVLILGGNATDLTGDPERTDAGVPNAQIYRPAYFFKGPRPVIEQAPDKIRYGRLFRVKMADGDAHKIGSVVLQRLGPVTHNWDWGNRHVRLSVHQYGKALAVNAPAVPGLALPGYYLLFAVSEEGIPSEARIVHLGDGSGRAMDRAELPEDQAGRGEG